MPFISDNIESEGYITGNTISAVSFFGSGINLTNVSKTEITGGTVSRTNNLSNILLNNSTGGTITISSITDTFTTGGTYNTGTVIFNNNVGGGFSVTGFSVSDTFITGFTFNPINNGLTISKNDNTSLNTSINTMSGLTINGLLRSNSISATTYLNLPIDIYTTGGTHSLGTTTFNNNVGGGFIITGYNVSDTFITGFTFNSVNNVLTISKNDNTSLNATIPLAKSIKNTLVLNFGDESDSVVSTINNALLTDTNFMSINFIPSETTETSLDDFNLNSLSFNIENIINNVSFDIRGNANQNASGNYTLNYIIRYQ